MKNITIIQIVLLFFTANLLAQDKQVDYELPKHYEPTSFVVSQDNGLFLKCQKIVMQNKLGVSVLKFDKNLKPVWKEPIAIKALNTDVNEYALAYTNPNTQATTDYVVEEGIHQVLPNGNVSLNTQIPKKEMWEKAAVFTNAEGINVLTIVGDETFPTGTLNWYTFSHEKMTQTKRTIKLPLPSTIDYDNNSGWRLNEVTASGLYFYYVSYKNDRKNTSSPILSNYVIHVDPMGKVGAILNMNPGIEKFNILPVEYEQDVYPNLIAVKPPLYERSNPMLWKSTSFSNFSTVAPPTKETGIIDKNYNLFAIGVPSDNSYMGVKINENAKRIYTVTALYNAVEAEKKGRISFSRADPPLETLVFSIYDLEGKQIAQSNLKITLPKLMYLDNYTKHAHHIVIQPMANNEGVICKLISNGSGFFWVFDNQGQLIQEEKFKRSFSKLESDNLYQTVYYHFPAIYTSLKDFRGSPYLLKEKSLTYQFLQNIEKKDKKNHTCYLSLKDQELIVVWDSKNDKLTFNSFTKN